MRNTRYWLMGILLVILGLVLLGCATSSTTSLTPQVQGPQTLEQLLSAAGFKQKTAYEIMPSLVGSEMCIRDRVTSLGGTLLTSAQWGLFFSLLLLLSVFSPLRALCMSSENLTPPIHGPAKPAAASGCFRSLGWHTLR